MLTRNTTDVLAYSDTIGTGPKCHRVNLVLNMHFGTCQKCHYMPDCHFVGGHICNIQVQVLSKGRNKISKTRPILSNATFPSRNLPPPADPGAVLLPAARPRAPPRHGMLRRQQARGGITAEVRL